MAECDEMIPPSIFYLAGYYFIWSLLLFLCMGIDKRRAKAFQRRIPETTLFILGLLGGAPGGLLGMSAFRHKTKKPAFYGIYIIGCLLHATILFLLFYGPLLP